MLSRSADSIFWLARYVERAESTARLLEMGRRMTMLPGSSDEDEWRSVARASGVEHLLDAAEPTTEAAIVNLLMLDDATPSSIRAALHRARANAKSVRTGLTKQMWETLNDGWRRLDFLDTATALRDFEQILDWVITRSATFRGATEAAMLRTDRHDFLVLGWLIERVDNTLRLLGVKYYVLLPAADVIGGGRDHHHWTSLLGAVSGLRAFRHTYRGDHSPWRIADFLILNPDFPRSLANCYERIVHHLENLARRYGARHPCHDTASRALANLSGLEAGEIFQSGLQEYIVNALSMNAHLSREISEAYYFNG